MAPTTYHPSLDQTGRTSWLSAYLFRPSACVPRAGSLGVIPAMLVLHRRARRGGHQFKMSVARLTHFELPAVPHWLGYWRAQTMPHTCDAEAVSASCAWLAVLTSYPTLPSPNFWLPPCPACRMPGVRGKGKGAWLIAFGPVLRCGRTLTMLKPAMQGRHKLSAAKRCYFRNTVFSLQYKKGCCRAV